MVCPITQGDHKQKVIYDLSHITLSDIHGLPVIHPFQLQLLQIRYTRPHCVQQAVVIVVECRRLSWLLDALVIFTQNTRDVSTSLCMSEGYISQTKHKHKFTLDWLMGVPFFTFLATKLQPDIEQVQALADISRSRYFVIATKPVHRLQIRPTKQCTRVRAVGWACGQRQTRTRVTNIHFAPLRLTRNVMSEQCLTTFLTSPSTQYVMLDCWSLVNGTENLWSIDIDCSHMPQLRYVGCAEAYPRTQPTLRPSRTTSILFCLGLPSNNKWSK